MPRLHESGTWWEPAWLKNCAGEPRAINLSPRSALVAVSFDRARAQHLANLLLLRDARTGFFITRYLMRAARLVRYWAGRGAYRTRGRQSYHGNRNMQVIVIVGVGMVRINKQITPTEVEGGEHNAQEQIEERICVPPGGDSRLLAKCSGPRVATDWPQ